MSPIEIANLIANNGGRLYLVGGAVRDEIMQRQISDYDYCIVGLSYEEVLELFPKALSYGKSFLVFNINGNEYALARKEIKTSSGHKGFEIISDKSITIEEDLRRRDITINSIAKDVLTGEYKDPYKGVEDIQNKIIRATSEAFIEDPLRVYRVARFAAQLDFEVSSDTIEMMKQIRPELNTLSVERIYTELVKVFKSQRPSRFFEVLRNADSLNVHFEEIQNLIGKTQPEKYHPEGDAFNHTMIVLDKVASQTDNDELIFAALVHDLGKGTTPKEMLPKHLGHEERGVELVKALCERLKLPKNYEKIGVVACLEHMRAGIFNEMRIPTKIDFIERIAKSAIGLKGMEILANADNTKAKPLRFAEAGEEMLEKVNAKNYPKDIEYKVLKERLRNERIEWFKNHTI
ncbi:MAG: HD domain-containing protein [Clostridia bacterium]|nr:HD domain-containing protein [Clostridia bacterium]